ncbi:DedA family protein [Cellulosilyticum ruminicola]|uniref:DedA family protein n=1 Tax=Cellulosilyticum ruminicola TaxID=425254 RepID=UPI0006D05093|nr:DedA family protein [Cellulosilyticum ruminicola]
MDIFTSFANYMIYLIEKLGYIGIFFVIGLEYACFPIPSEVVLPFVGMSIPQTSLSFLPSFLISIVAGLFGSLICYAIGLYGGEPLLHALAKRSSGLQTALDKFDDWFVAYGRWAVLLTRIVPLTRTYISLFAGVSHMPLHEFLLYSSTGIALWNLVLMSIGFYIGNNWALIEQLLNTYSNIALGVLAALVISFVIMKFYKKGRI